MPSSLPLPELTAEREAERAQLARARRDLEEVVYFAAHHLAEPLALVSGYAGLLARNHSEHLGPDAAELMAAMLRSAEEVNARISWLRDYARVETAGRPMARADCSRIADDAIRALGLAEDRVLVGPLP